MKGFEGEILKSELLPTDIFILSETAHRSDSDWDLLRELGYTVWATNRPCSTELTVDGGGLIVAINFG